MRVFAVNVNIENGEIKLEEKQKNEVQGLLQEFNSAGFRKGEARAVVLKLR